MKIIDDINPAELFQLIDKKWLFSGLWHLKGSVEEGERALQYLEENVSAFGFEPKLVYEKFNAEYENGALKLLTESGEEISNFKFDDAIFNKFSKSRPLTGEVVLLAATVGDNVKNIIDSKHAEGDYKEYFYLNGFAAALAEAVTEFAHQEASREYGFQYLKSFRLSPGYSVWPALEDQLIISRLLPLEKIDVVISETLQLHPEFSTTAVVFICK